MSLRAFALLLLLAGSGCVIDLSGFTRVQPLEESVVSGESGPKIVLLEIKGLITEATERSPFGPERPSLIARTREELERAAEDDEVVALVLRIQSPGGTVSASETLFHELSRWKQETGLPLIAYFDGLATSGGYYVGMAADRIIAHPTTVTGSIGVIMLGFNFSGLMEKVGIADQTLTTGPFKDAGSPFRPMQPDEREQLQGVLDELQERFREVVGSGRSALGAGRIVQLADGRIYTARQAKELGLIDEIGYLESSIEAAEAAAGIEESRVVRYHRPNEYRTNIYSRSELPPVQLVDVNVFTFGRPALAPGFYYLWPGALQGP